MTMQSLELCWSVAIIPGTDDIMLMLSLTIIPNIESYNNSNPLSSARIRFCTLSLDDKNVQNGIVKTSREWLSGVGGILMQWLRFEPSPDLFVPPFLFAYESPILSIIDIDQTIARLEIVDDKPKL